MGNAAPPGKRPILSLYSGRTERGKKIRRSCVSGHAFTNQIANVGLRRFATYHDDLRQITTFRNATTICDESRRSATTRQGGPMPGASKDAVVEHKGSSDEPLFFRPQRERGQYLPPGDRLPDMSDECQTPKSGAKNIVQESRSEPLYVGVLRRLETVKGRLRMHRV